MRARPLLLPLLLALCAPMAAAATPSTEANVVREAPIDQPLSLELSHLLDLLMRQRRSVLIEPVIGPERGT